MVSSSFEMETFLNIEAIIWWTFTFESIADYVDIENTWSICTMFFLLSSSVNIHYFYIHLSNVQ